MRANTQTHDTQTHKHTCTRARMLAHTQTDKQTTSKPSGIAKGHVPPQMRPREYAFPR